MADTDEIFPTCMRAGSRDHWLAWASRDEGDCLLLHGGQVICADDEAALRSVVNSALRRTCMEETSYVDVDAALAQLRAGRVADAELIIDIWNLFTDLFRALGAGPRQMFFRQHRHSYDVFFSRCGVAEMVDIDAQTVGADDILRAAQVLEAGVAMMLECRARQTPAEQAHLTVMQP